MVWVSSDLLAVCACVLLLSHSCDLFVMVARHSIAKPCGFYTRYYLSSNYNNIYNNYVLYAITNVTTVMYCIVVVSHDCYMFSYRCTLLLCIQYVYTRF